MSADAVGVSFVVPVRDGERWLDRVLASIYAQHDGRPVEVLVVDDGSHDRSREILTRHAQAGHVKLLSGLGRGAAAAINLGIRHAQYPIICQVDQDVILGPGWLKLVLAELEDPEVAAVQGYYATDRSSSFWARVMGLDVEYRYSRISGRYVDHCCSGNTAYRASALHAVGLFDETFGYCYDNDLSYRLEEAGHRLVFCREARSTHRWREDLAGYLRQQYGVGYGRLSLVAKHGRYRGDDVSRLPMILHAPIMLAVTLALLAATGLAIAGAPWTAPALGAAALLVVLAGDRLASGIHATMRFGTVVGLYFVPVHLLRDLAWVAAQLRWTIHRLGGLEPRPSDSM
jgi:succinoglycan biosynthesis protein ExoA